MKLKLTNMIRSIFLALIIFWNLSCKNNNYSKDLKEMQKMDLSNFNEINKHDHITYAISLTIYFPFELYLDDIPIEISKNGSSMAARMNPFLLKNGEHTIRIKILPNKVDNLFDKQVWGMQSIGLARWTNDDNGIPIDETIETIERFTLLPVPLNLPYFEQQWIVKIKDLPYELEGWSGGQDLSKWDKEVLQKKVVAYYEQLRTILNNGDADTWLNLTKIRSQETDTFDYVPNSIIREKFEENSREIREECKGNMMPLEDYTMKIYGIDSQLVSLERNATKTFEGYDANIEGWSPLIKNDNGDINEYPVKLYLPKGSNEFVIIRK